MIKKLLIEKLSQVSIALDRVARRFEEIHSADDFLASERGLDMLDSICHDAYCCWREWAFSCMAR